MKILVGAKSGGHSVEAAAIKKKFHKAECVIVTSEDDRFDYNCKTYKLPKLRYDWPPFRFRFKNILVNFILSLWIFIKERPNKVFCAGANNSLFIGIIARLFGQKVIGVQAITRTKTIAKSNKILWKLGCEIYWKHSPPWKDPKFTYVGKIHPYKKNFKKWSQKPKTAPLVVIPSVMNGSRIKKYPPGFIKSHKEFLKLLARAKLVITRAGMAAFEAANLSKKVIVAFHPKSINGHQKRFSRWLDKNYDNVEIRKNLKKEVCKAKESL